MVKLMGLLCESKRVERKKITYDFPVFTSKLHLKFLKCANSVKTDCALNPVTLSKSMQGNVICF